MRSDGQRNIEIKCQECNRVCIIIEYGKVTFTGIGVDVICAGCKAWLSRQKRGGMSL